MRLCVDIDGTICETHGLDYSSASPIDEAVQALRKLNEEGHYIILFTARGSGTGIDHSALTIRQLASWGVPYDELHFGKPFADFYIDDKAIVASTWHAAISNHLSPNLHGDLLNNIAIPNSPS